MKILSTNISEQKGTIKKPTPHIVLYENGVMGDAHAGKWHRQVSLLGIESINHFKEKLGRPIEMGEFAENLTTEGLVLFETAPLDIFKCGPIEIMVTQIGKKCHGDNCAIFKEVGSCVMPKEGIFCKVLTGGIVKPDDDFEYRPYEVTVKIITLSDRASKGEYEDLSGPRVLALLEKHFKETHRHFSVSTKVIPDDKDELEKIISDAVKENTDFIFTTGGTGIGPRDITPDVIKPMLDKEIPGIMEFIRNKYGKDKPNALISRSVSGTIGNSIIYTLPGSVKAVNEYMNEISTTLEHSLKMMKGLDSH